MSRRAQADGGSPRDGRRRVVVEDVNGSTSGTRKAVRPVTLARALLNASLAVVLPAVALGALLVALVLPRRTEVLKSLVDPSALIGIMAALVVTWLLWVLLIWRSWHRSHPSRLSAFERNQGRAVVVMLCILITMPMAVAVRYAAVQHDLVTTLFNDQLSANAPDLGGDNPWGKRKRVNILLLGGDGGVDRQGIRTDSMIMVSVLVKSGKPVMFSLPRNLQEVPFPQGSPLREIYPDGFVLDDGPSESMLNAVYRNVPALHPGVLGRSDNEGADAVKEAVSGALGVRVDYYLLVNLSGFEQIVDAIGGITVNINEPVAIGGNKDAGIPPDDYLEPGPDQRLDGFEALWFTRGRWGSNDYARMQRQRCAISAIVKESDPVNLISRYTDLASASKRILRTDIPQDLLPALVDLALKMKDQQMKSVTFELSDDFNPNDPDFDYVHNTVRKALAGKPKKKAGAKPPAPGSPSAQATQTPEESPDASPSTEAGEAADTAEACSYQPVGSDSGSDSDGEVSEDSQAADE